MPYFVLVSRNRPRRRPRPRKRVLGRYVYKRLDTVRKEISGRSGPIVRSFESSKNQLFDDEDDYEKEALTNGKSWARLGM